MRKIEELLLGNERVWFYVTEEWQQSFYDELVEMNAKFMNGDSVTKDVISRMMGVGRDATVGYVSHLVWYYSFFSSSEIHLKVDYGKYRGGEDEYLITEPNIRPISLSELELVD